MSFHGGFVGVCAAVILYARSQKIDLLAGKADNLRQTMRKTINSDCFAAGTGFGGKSVGGLQVLVPDDPTAGTRGGISAATYTSMVAVRRR